MRVIHAKPETYDHRRRLRRSDMPNLQVFGTPPTIVKTTTDDVTDEEVGLDADAWAQAEAERFIRAALAYRRQEARKIKTVS